MKSTKQTTGTRLHLSGALAAMRWVKVSRRSAPASTAKSAAADTVYGIRTSEDIVKAPRRLRSDMSS